MLDSGGLRPDSDEILSRLGASHPKLIDLSLDRIERLLDCLGNPERSLAPVVHVAGTNGKGSTIAFMRAMLEAANYRVQAYISPHLVRFHERIRLTKGLIAEPDLVALLAECEGVNGGAPITYFEMTTAAALLAFSREPADVLLLEVGLGGRFDATNIIAEPGLCVITPISADHQQFLGDTLRSIAREKAGIIKTGVPVVVAPQPVPALDVIRDRASLIGAPICVYGEDWEIASCDRDRMRFRDGDGELILPMPALAGAHQTINAGAAIACLRRLVKFRVDERAISLGLKTATWPGRLQHLRDNPLTELLPPGSDLWLDGGHNPAAAEALSDFLGPARSVHLIVGMMGSKNVSDFLKPLAAHATFVHAIEIPAEAGCMAPSEIAAAARRLGIHASVANNVEAAMRAISRQCRQGQAPSVLICGSLYLAGAVLRTL